MGFARRNRISVIDQLFQHVLIVARERSRAHSLQQIEEARIGLAHRALEFDL